MTTKAGMDLGGLRRELLRLTYIYGYRRGSFLLSSGRRSNYYIDGKQVTMSAAGLYALALYINLSLREKNISADAVGGLTLGADPIAAAVAALSEAADKSRSLSCFIVRKEAKGHGTRSRLEGPFYRGIRAVIVDDVLTTGASVLSAARAVAESGGEAKAAYVLVDRQEGGREAVEAAGLDVEAVITRADLEALQEQLEHLYPGTFAALQDEPVQWAALSGKELSQRQPELFRELKQPLQALAAARRAGTLEDDRSRQAARDVLTVIKAAELEGREKAAAILQRLKQAYG